MKEHVILVDNDDNQIGEMPKLEAHQKGVLHRAFSIFIFNSKNEVLLQQRAKDKYHSAGLWSNTCCSHPAPGETTEEAVKRRLKQEMGMTCEMTPAFNFIYHAAFDNGLTEYEFDHVYFGVSDSIPEINKEEVNDWKYMSISDLILEINNNPKDYTEWLKLCLGKVIKFKMSVR